MNKIKSHNDLREAFAKFWQERGHREIPPIRLVPENDPTTLFTGSGMQQLVPFLLGQEHPLGTRLYNIQRSFRSQDIEEVGDNRHTTFFEMMGNWSLGDYFKEKQLSWLWEFLTITLGLPKELLYVTVFEGNKDVPKDEESIRIWKKLGVADDHIHAYPAKKNWWSRAGEPEKMPTGEVGGPTSEVFYEFKEIKHDLKFGKICHPNCDCGKFIEIGNSVFMTHKKQKDGALTELPKKNVDFGGGLERLLMAIYNTPDVFKTDAFPITTLEKLSGKKYGTDETLTRSFRILADHLRAATMLLGDGVMPSNTEQGYVLRRLIRRAIRFSKNLELTASFTTEVAKEVIHSFEKPYPHLKTQKEKIMEELSREEQKFQKTLTRGLGEFERMAKNNTLTGKDAFFLYESYGFPIEITQELAQERNIKLDLKEFEEEKKRHQEVSKKGMEKKFRGGLADHSENTVKLHTATHLLHNALRTILGPEVGQKGSNITGERLRFDFSFPRALTKEELKQVEKMINKRVGEGHEVWFEVLDKNEALKLGALAFFGEKYWEKVNVYFIGEKGAQRAREKAFSKEFCGGPHVTNTKDIGHVTITKEESAGSGIRRIYAVIQSSS